MPDPSKESIEYVESIEEDVRWLGFDWGNRLFYASDYYEQLYQYAVELIKAGKAYVCSLSAEEIREYRGTLTELQPERRGNKGVPRHVDGTGKGQPVSEPFR
jgi:glutaminyl-tRNA synthetase